jgi:hypothetical protein
MSSYKKLTKNPKTGEFEEAFWMDDYFGEHKYGVKFPDGEVYKSEEIFEDDIKVGACTCFTQLDCDQQDCECYQLGFEAGKKMKGSSYRVGFSKAHDFDLIGYANRLKWYTDRVKNATTEPETIISTNSLLAYLEALESQGGEDLTKE